MDVSGYAAECGAKIKPGFKSKLYLVCACDIEIFPDRKTTTGIGDKITIDGEIVLKPGKKFAEIDIISNTGEVKSTAVGERTSKSFKNTFDFETQKDIASDEWFDIHVNGCFVGIVTEKDGTKRVFGTPEVPAFIMAAEGSTGAKNEDKKSWIAQLIDETGDVVPVYDGAIDLTA